MCNRDSPGSCMVHAMHACTVRVHADVLFVTPHLDHPLCSVECARLIGISGALQCVICLRRAQLSLSPGIGPPYNLTYTSSHQTRPTDQPPFTARLPADRAGL